MADNSMSTGGFNFENCNRNEMLKASGYPIPKITKTGTTIAGIVFKDGVILGADTRATEGSLIAVKNCYKIHYLSSNIYYCGAGTAADTKMVSQMISSQLELLRLEMGKTVPVVCANTLLKRLLFRYQGYLGVALVLGGVDSQGGSIYCIYPHGSSDKLPYATMGSGSLAAMSVFERGWKPDMELEEGKKLVRDAIAAGILNDLGSGGTVDLCVITKEGASYLRPYEVISKKGEKIGTYKYNRGATAILSKQVIPLEIEETIMTA